MGSHLNSFLVRDQLNVETIRLTREVRRLQLGMAEKGDQRMEETETMAEIGGKMEEVGEMEESAVTTVGDISHFPGVAGIQYEYLDHTADVQLHAWGHNLAEAFEQTTMAMFGYMTELETVDVVYTYDIEARGEDLMSLLFHVLDEWLFAFSAEPFFIPRSVQILHLDRECWTVRARGWGESFDIHKHPQGTEVKAITYSNMQIHENEDKVDTYVIIDI